MCLLKSLSGEDCNIPAPNGTAVRVGHRLEGWVSTGLVINTAWISQKVRNSHAKKQLQLCKENSDEKVRK